MVVSSYFPITRLSRLSLNSLKKKAETARRGIDERKRRGKDGEKGNGQGEREAR